jgi:hypothetical protein
MQTKELPNKASVTVLRVPNLINGACVLASGEVCDRAFIKTDNDEIHCLNNRGFLIGPNGLVQFSDETRSSGCLKGGKAFKFGVTEELCIKSMELSFSGRRADEESLQAEFGRRMQLLYKDWQRWADEQMDRAESMTKASQYGEKALTQSWALPIVEKDPSRLGVVFRSRRMEL